MQAASIVGFVSTLFLVILTVVFALVDRQAPTRNGVLTRNPALFYGVGGILLFAALVLELLLLIMSNDSAWEVRLSALDLTVVVGFVILTVAMMQQDGRFARWNQTPQILIFVIWGLALINLISNLVVFFGTSCRSCDDTE